MSKIECVLITGGHGFIGTHLIPMLNNDLPIVVVDNLVKQVHPRLQMAQFFSHVDTYVGDISDSKLWDRVFEKYKPITIIHLAAETSTGLSAYQIDVHTRTNINGLAVLLTSLTKYGIFPKRFVIASSRAVYGEGEWDDPQGRSHVAKPRLRQDLLEGIWNPRSQESPEIILERPKGQCWSTTAKNPTSVYGLTKSVQEDLLKLWTGSNDVKLSILRFQNVYGPGQTPSNSYTGILGIFIRSAMQKDTLKVFEQGNIIRDFIFVADVAKAIVKSLETETSCLIADVGTGRQLTLLEVASQISTYFEAPPPVTVRDFREGDVRAAFSNPDGWMQDWSPLISFEEGLPSTIDYVKDFFNAHP